MSILQMKTACTNPMLPEGVPIYYKKTLKFSRKHPSFDRLYEANGSVGFLETYATMEIIAGNVLLLDIRTHLATPELWPTSLLGPQAFAIPLSIGLLHVDPSTKPTGLELEPST